MHGTIFMNGAEFIRRIRKLGRKRGVAVIVTKDRGKGSHQTLSYSGHETVVKHGEIGQGLLATMLKQLGLTKKDL